MASTVGRRRMNPNGQRGPVTTLAQYLAAVKVTMRERRGQRKGQTFFNVLHEMEPELADRITGTDADPFYDDGKLPDFLLRVADELR
jgi:hypothetical protein